MAIILLIIAVLVIHWMMWTDMMDWAGCFEKSCIDQVKEQAKKNQEHLDELVVAAKTLIEVAQSLRINRVETARVGEKILTEVPVHTADLVDKKIEQRARNGGH